MEGEGEKKTQNYIFYAKVIHDHDREIYVYKVVWFYTLCNQTIHTNPMNVDN